MNRTIVAVLASIISVAAAALLSAQTVQSASAGAGYDTATEVVLSGKVTEVVGLEGIDGSLGLHLGIESDGVRFELQVGPVLYIAGENFSFAIGDQIEVTAAKVAGDGKVLWPRQIKFGTRVLKLRKESGAPLWVKDGEPLPTGADGCGHSHPARGVTN